MMDIKKIYTGDYYADGFADGAKQGQAGKPEWLYSVFKRVQPANYIFNFNRAYSTYFQGYHAGHAEGLKANLLATTLHNHGETMTQSPPPDGLRSYEAALQKLNHTKRTIEANSLAFTQALQKYEQKINEAKAAGMLDDYIQGLRKQYGQLKIKQERMQMALVSLLEAIDAVEDKIRYLIEQSER